MVVMMMNPIASDCRFSAYCQKCSFSFPLVFFPNNSISTTQRSKLTRPSSFPDSTHPLYRLVRVMRLLRRILRRIFFNSKSKQCVGCWCRNGVLIDVKLIDVKLISSFFLPSLIINREQSQQTQISAHEPATGNHP